MTRLLYLETQFYMEGHLSALGCGGLLVKEQKQGWGSLRDTHQWSGLGSLLVRPWQKGTNDQCACSGGQTTPDALCL